jgi:hypothetical protein
MADERPNVRPKPYLGTTVPGIEPKIDCALLVEHVGVKPGTQEYDTLHDAVRREVTFYPAYKAALDDSGSVALQDLTRLKKAWQRTGQAARFSLWVATEAADAELNLTTLELSLDHAIETLKTSTEDSSTRQRRTEGARNMIAGAVALLFKDYYRLGKDPEVGSQDYFGRNEYRHHLDAFLRGLFQPNGIAYPHKRHDPKTRDAFLRSLHLI